VLRTARAVADAVLYEGYALYPYRASATKNRERWQFGVLVPPGYRSTDEPWRQRTECVLEGRPEARLHVLARFLQVLEKQVQRRDDDGVFRPVESLGVDGVLHVSFDDAVERVVEIDVPLGRLAAAPVVRAFAFGDAADAHVDDLGGVARVVRTAWPIRGEVRVGAEPVDVPFRASKLRLDVENTTPWQLGNAPRPEAIRRSLVAVHCLLHVEGGAFVSSLDPPAWAAPAVRSCASVGAFPVLVGDGDRRDAVLSSPIILYDHPQVAPESPGDLFDATEIDEILSLRTRSLTDDEKREARASDPRTAALLDRVDSMPPEIERLHGAVRSLRPASATSRAAPAEPRPWDPDAGVDPGTDLVEIDGISVGRGARVRLAPSGRGSDAHDRFLRGRIARVEAVFVDLDDLRHVAVTLEDDPAGDLQESYPRFLYFAPGEIEPLEEVT
jgi:hypothetical protein